MTTYSINFTDFTGKIWTMDWKPTSSKNKKLTAADIDAVAAFIKTGNWPKSVSAAAKNCYDTLAAQIANAIIEHAHTRSSYAGVLLEDIANAYRFELLSKNGLALFKQCMTMTDEDPTPEKYALLLKRLKKLIKSENLFAVKFAEDDYWAITSNYHKIMLVQNESNMKCCICGAPIADDNYGHNPYPVRPESWYGEKENRCCSTCNSAIVLPVRLRYGRYTSGLHEKLMEMNAAELEAFTSDLPRFF